MKIVFLGSSGGRRITFTQKRASGGFLVGDNGCWIHVDPGPGAFVRLIQIGVDPMSLSGFVLSHRHMDHSADINTLIEARTMGGWNPGGVLFAPEDALEGDDPVVFRYHRGNLERIGTLKEGFSSAVGSVQVKVALKHRHHGVETYGLIFEADRCRVGYVTDGLFEEKMLEAYAGCDVLLINTTFRHRRELEHLCLDDAVAILSAVKPSVGIITHFGAEIVFWGLDRAASYVEERSGVKVIPAKEFIQVSLGNSFALERLKLVNPIGIAYKSRSG